MKIIIINNFDCMRSILFFREYPLKHKRANLSSQQRGEFPKMSAAIDADAAVLLGIAIDIDWENRPLADDDTARGQYFLLPLFGSGCVAYFLSASFESRVTTIVQNPFARSVVNVSANFTPDTHQYPLATKVLVRGPPSYTAPRWRRHLKNHVLHRHFTQWTKRLKENIYPSIKASHVNI